MEERYGVIEGTSYCYIVDRWASGLKVIEKADSKIVADKRAWELNYGWKGKKKYRVSQEHCSGCVWLAQGVLCPFVRCVRWNGWSGENGMD